MEAVGPVVNTRCVAPPVSLSLTTTACEVEVDALRVDVSFSPPNLEIRTLLFGGDDDCRHTRKAHKLFFFSGQDNGYLRTQICR